VAHEQALGVEVYRGDQPVFVPADIKDVKIAAFHPNHVHAGEGSLQLGEILKVPAPRQLQPRS
jgi:hypothetical protein